MEVTLTWFLSFLKDYPTLFKFDILWLSSESNDPRTIIDKAATCDDINSVVSFSMFVLLAHFFSYFYPSFPGTGKDESIVFYYSLFSIRSVFEIFLTNFGCACINDTK